MQQLSYGPLIMSIMLKMSCYTGFFNVRRGWQSLNTGTRFYLRLIRRTGWLWISTSRTTDGRPFKPKKLSVPFLYPGAYYFIKKKQIPYVPKPLILVKLCGHASALHIWVICQPSHITEQTSKGRNAHLAVNMIYWLHC